MTMTTEMEDHARVIRELVRKTDQIQRAGQHLHRLENLVDKQATLIDILIHKLKEDKL